MRSIYNFVVTPKGERYNNKKKVGDSELILNTDIYRHEFVNRTLKDASKRSYLILGRTTDLTRQPYFLFISLFIASLIIYSS